MACYVARSPLSPASRNLEAHGVVPPFAHFFCSHSVAGCQASETMSKLIGFRQQQPCRRSNPPWESQPVHWTPAGLANSPKESLIDMSRPLLQELLLADVRRITSHILPKVYFTIYLRNCLRVYLKIYLRIYFADLCQVIFHTPEWFEC